VIEPVDYGDVRYFRMAKTVGGLGLYWTGVYFVDGLLIDSGPPNLQVEAERLFRELRVQACATTHHHEDHSGNNALLSARFGITPFAHPLGIGRLAAPAPLHMYRRVAWGSPPPSVAQPAGDTIDTARFTFRLIYTPGHADDHVVLFEPNRGWLFSGDLYLSSRLKFLRDDEDVFALMDSLERMIGLEPDVMFCQHRGRLDRPAALLRRKLESLREMEAAIRRLHATGRSEKEIARALPGRDLFWRVSTRGHFSKRNFVRAFLRPQAAAE
jgi:glyoxylase-like metal-dependent hydrolase (beta-lactamase superfamily II)